MTTRIGRALAAEFIGTGFLVAAVVGSGVMAGRLSGGNAALALLANTVATGAALVSLILTFGPISGAHFNPVVTVVECINGKFLWQDVTGYVLAQCCGGIAGTLLAHAMFALRAISFSQHARSGPSQFLSECVATFGLVAVIQGCSRERPNAVPFAVATYITAAYWFTASTSFANPAVTIARCLSDTFAGIRPGDVPLFISAQFVGGLSAAFLFRWMASAPQSEGTVSVAAMESEIEETA